MGRLLSQYVPPTMASHLLSRAGGGLPSGEITFLLTDVVGSTAAWEREPRAMGHAMRRHDVLINNAVETHGGAMVRPRGEGDSRFAVFLRPDDAAAAAVDIARCLDAEQWDTSSPVRVRTALHTGEAELREGDYYGSVVNRCARIRSTADPGQILVSSATAALIDGSVPEGTELRSLGARALKDITEPEDVWELALASRAGRGGS
jgi:class 3 adenylate cyclase